MELLKGMKAYLSGSIEASSDHGVGWRLDFMRLSWERGLPIGFIDPCNKGSDAIQEEIAEEREKLQRLKAAGDYDEVRKVMKLVRGWDLRAVDYSNFVIAMIDKSIPTWGTPDECIVAERQRKPIVAIVKGGPSKAPDWTFGIVRHEEMFFDIEGAIDYLCKINSGEIAMDKRWIHIPGIWNESQIQR